jgi:Trk K+ transport system NAD-binding subunit
MHRLIRIYRYALFLLDRFKYLILLAVIVFLISALVIYHYHPDQANPETRRGLAEVSFGVFELMFASQPVLEFPRHGLGVQLIYFALPILNILGLAAAVAQFSQILFNRDLYNRAQANNADGHLILCGLGRLGREVLKQLDERYGVKDRRDIVIVELGTGDDALETAYLDREPIIPVLHGNMIDPATLRSAGIERAVAIVMLTGNDTTNLESGLLARELNPNVRVVLRMSNQRVTRRLNAMLQQSPIQNFQLIDSVEGSAPKCVELCCFTDRPDANGHLIICGLGRLGFGILRLLKGRVSMVVIDKGERCHFVEDSLVTSDPTITVIRGDMTTRSMLQQAGVDRAAAVLIMTPSDTENLEAAMLVSELNPNVRTVMRISNSRISHRLDRVLCEAFGERLRVIDPSEYAAPVFVDAVASAYEQATPAAAAHAEAARRESAADFG